MARITQRKMVELARSAERLVASIDRMQNTILPMLANPRAKYGQVCRLLRNASDDLAEARRLGALAAGSARSTGPRTDTDLWRDADTVRQFIDAAADHAHGAAASLREAAEVLA